MPPYPRISARDSGKPLVDASFGEVLGTCEKIWWLCSEGECYLKPESRSAGYMVRSRVGRGGLLEEILSGLACKRDFIR